MHALLPSASISIRDVLRPSAIVCGETSKRRNSQLRQLARFPIPWKCPEPPPRSRVAFDDVAFRFSHFSFLSSLISHLSSHFSFRRLANYTRIKARLSRLLRITSVRDSSSLRVYYVCTYAYIIGLLRKRGGLFFYRSRDTRYNTYV